MIIQNVFLGVGGDQGFLKEGVNKQGQIWKKLGDNIIPRPPAGDKLLSDE